MNVRLAVTLMFLAGCSTARPVDETRRCASEADCARVHPPGIADPDSPDFHANLVVSTGYKLDLCQSCHGDDFSGGTSGRTCLKCHADGPTSCTTCHGQPPATGAHAAHSPRFDCTECHVKPMVYTDVGHLFDEHGDVIASPRITFGPLARTAPAVPSFDRDAKQCSSVYCHGAASPVWTGGPSQAACGTCHGNPPASHAGRNSNCSLCHPSGEAKHVNGTVNVGDDSGTCLACHPSPGGAHASHTQALHRLAPALGCGECHFVPQNVDDPGHIDHPDAIVFPPGTSARARGNGANPTYDAAANTCSSVYCHGGGSVLAADQAPTINRTPTFVPGSGAADCGACHGIPPQDGAHLPGTQLTDCHNCHRTVDATGALKPATHMNGVVDGP